VFIKAIFSLMPLCLLVYGSFKFQSYGLDCACATLPSFASNRPILYYGSFFVDVIDGRVKLHLYVLCSIMSLNVLAYILCKF
jgi:hypothetical protein